MFDLQVKCRNGERYLLKPGFGTSTPTSGGPDPAEAYRLLQRFDDKTQLKIYRHFFGIGRPIDPMIEQKEHPTGNGVSRPPSSPIAKNEDVSLYAARYQFDDGISKPLFLAFISKRIIVDPAPLTNYENEELSGSLKVQIRQALTEIVIIERREKSQIHARYQQLSTWKKFTAHTSATSEGLAEAAWGLAVWAKDVGEVIVYANPVRKAYITTRKAIEAGGFSDEVLEQSHNEFVTGAKKELVDVLGFDPSTVTVEQLYAALELAELIYADKPLFTLFTQFAKDYAKAQHSTEVAKIAGGGVFEIILTVVLASVTGGAAVVAMMASKARLMKYFTKVGNLVMEYAKVLKRRKKILEESASKSKSADFSDFETSDYSVPKEKAKESYVRAQPVIVTPENRSEIERNLVAQLGSEIKNNPMRRRYENEVSELAKYQQALADQNLRDKSIYNMANLPGSEKVLAEKAHQARRELGVKYKNLTPEPLRDYIYEVNNKRYGDPLGPSVELLIQRGKTYEEIVKSASRPNPDVDKLLKGFGKWLSKQPDSYLQKHVNLISGVN